MKRDWALMVLGIGSTITYVAVARLAGAEGFPLDDAWIHQTYARNLGLHGQWAFSLGQPSAGSTSPLWTMLLAIGYVLRVDHAVWTTAVNSLLLGVLAWLAYMGSGRWWIGVLIALEWHLVWAAASGMETVLFCVLVMGAFVAAVKGGDQPHIYLACGVLTGLCVWTRPDGLTLLPFTGWLIWKGNMAGAVRSQRIKQLGLWVGGVAAILIPYFLFNLALSGQLWPNTFFAKQAEYAILRELPLWQRLWEIFSTPFIGLLVLLLPGVGLRARERHVELGWVCVFLLSYAWRLPVIYQHGRYLIPVIPVLIVVGGEGAARWVQTNTAHMMRRVISRAWVLGLGVVTIVFWALGLRALMTDVDVINTEMVATANWVAANIPAGTIVAAHDIGALGYYADVRLIDLAGLISPDVIPLMGNEEKMWVFIREGQAAYVITYPGWCPLFTQNPELEPVFQTGPLCEPETPNLHMIVYRIR